MSVEIIDGKVVNVILVDPPFFMSQRGEATTAEWKAKVAEIKTRYPYPAEPINERRNALEQF